MTIGNTPVDQGLVIPLPTVISPDNTGQTTGNVTPVPVQGHPGSYLDSGGNPTTAVMTGYLYPRIVQKANNITGSAGKTRTCAFTSANNQGNSIVVCVGIGEVENGTTITLAITDSLGNTYTQVKNSSQSTTLEAAIFYATNIIPGSNTVTVTIAGASSSNTAIAVEIYEVWGYITVAGSSPDQTATGTNAGSTAVTTGAISPNVPNCLAFMAIAAGNGVISAGSGWTLDSGSLAPTGGNLIKFGSQSRQLPTIDSVIPAATLGTSVAWAACVATFKSVIVPIEGTVKDEPVDNSTPSSVAGSASSVTLFAANPAARGRMVFNESTATLYIAYSATATTSAYVTQIPPSGYWEMPKPVYRGVISGIWSAANGNARLTEVY